jgi:hypothetical protein
LNPVKPTQESSYLITVFFSIIKGFCKSEVELCFALGKKGSDKSNRKALHKTFNDVVDNLLSKNSTCIPPEVLSPSASINTAPTASITENASSRESLSPAPLPEDISFPPSDTIDVTSPMSISFPSINSNESNIFASPKARTRNMRDSILISPMVTSPITTISTPGSVLATQVKKKACVQETPIRTERQLFDDVPTDHPAKSTAISSECFHLFESLKDAKDDEEIERLTLDFISRRADDGGIIHNKKLLDHRQHRQLSADTTERNRRIWLQSKTHSVMEFIRTHIPGAANDPDIVKHILTKTIENNLESVVCEKDDVDGKITAIEMTEVRNRAGWKMPSSAVAQIVKDLVHLLRLKNKLRVDKSPVEGQLRKKLGQIERDGSIPSTFEYVTCFITKDDTGKCIY